MCAWVVPVDSILPLHRHTLEGKRTISFARTIAQHNGTKEAKVSGSANLHRLNCERKAVYVMGGSVGVAGS